MWMGRRKDNWPAVTHSLVFCTYGAFAQLCLKYVDDQAADMNFMVTTAFLGGHVAMSFYEQLSSRSLEQRRILSSSLGTTTASTR